MKKKRATHAVFIFLAAAAPLALAVYALAVSKEPLSWRWGIDAAAFVSLSLGVFLLFPSRRWIRVPLAFIFTGFCVFFHVGNVVYQRFYNTWVHPHIFDQWRDGLVLGASVHELLGPVDLVFGVLLPMAAALAAACFQEDIPRRKIVPALFVSAAALVCLHHFTVGLPLRTRHNEPLMYFLRAPFYTRMESASEARRLRLVRENLDLYYPFDKEKYLRSEGADPPFSLVPKAGEKPPDIPYNIVFILMESVVAQASGTYGANPSYTPTLDALAQDSLVARNFYANGSQTARGELACLCSYYPNLRGGPIYTRYHRTKMRCLPEILQSFGYQTLWIASYKKTYSKKSRFLARHGIMDIYDIGDIPRPYNKIGWGPSDEDLFASALTRLDAAPEPFFAEIMTLSNHHPFDFDYPSNSLAPKGGYPPDFENYMRGNFYTDYALGKFFKEVKSRDWFDRTIFVLTGDQGIWLFPENPPLSPVEKQERYFRVPFLIYAPGIVPPQVLTRVASQVDMAPTLMDILGASSKNTFVGRSMLAEAGPPRFALMVHDRQWNIRRENDYCYDVGEECFYEHIPRCPKGYRKDPGQPVSCFQFSEDLLAGSDRWSAPPVSRKDPELLSFAQALTGFNHSLLIKTPKKRKR